MQRKRAIRASIEGKIEVGSRVVNASIAFEGTNGVTMTLQAQERPLSLRDVIPLFVGRSIHPNYLSPAKFH